MDHRIEQTSTTDRQMTRPLLTFIFAGPLNIGMWIYSLIVFSNAPWGGFVAFLLAPTIVLAAILVGLLLWRPVFRNAWPVGATLLAWAAVTLISPFIMQISGQVIHGTGLPDIPNIVQRSLSLYREPGAFLLIPFFSAVIGWASAFCAATVAYLLSVPVLAGGEER